MKNEGFFGRQTEQSVIKARILSKYFWLWAKNVCGPARRRDVVNLSDMGISMPALGGMETALHLLRLWCFR